MGSGSPPLPLLLVTLLVAVLFHSVSSLPSTSPAFLWSPHNNELLINRLHNAVHYQTLSPKDLAKSVLYEGGWSNILCSRKEAQHSVDLAIVFVGTELQSSSINGDEHADPALLDLLKVSFTSSNFSMAFPYVDASGKDTIENLIVSEFKESCGNDLGISNGALLGMCTVKEETLPGFSVQDSVDEYLVSRMQKKSKGQAELVVICHKGSIAPRDLDGTLSESKSLSKIMTSLEQMGAKYEVLYVSDPFNSIRHSSYGKLERFLAEGNESTKSTSFTTCDGVCQIKSSLLEGLLVGIVLLIILLSGLCCMMGIDTPTRFETPQDS